MNTKRPLAPAFINRLDRYLLLHKPEAWTARTHLVVYYGLLFIVLLAAIAFVVPDDPRKPPPAWYWVGFVSLLSFIALIGWLIYLLRFNLFKRYGITRPQNRLAAFILYAVAIGTFNLFPYVEPYVETVRANAAYTSAELVHDIDKTNLGICRLEYDSLNHEWRADTVLVKNTISANENESYGAGTDTIVLIPHPPMTVIRKEDLKSRVAVADSVQKLNDSMYAFFEPPVYTLVQPYRMGIDDSTKPLTSAEIYRQVIKNYSPPANKQQIKDELAAIRKKYQWSSNYPGYYIDHSTVLDRIKYRYGLSYISESLNNILERKHRWSAENRAVFGRVFIYTTLIFSLLLFAFRHTSAKTFFLSVLTVIVLTILTSLVLAFSSRGGNAFFEWVFFYFALSLGLSLTAYTMKKRSAITGIAINIFLWLLPFMPLCIVADYYADRKYDPAYNYIHDYALQQKLLVWAEIGGLALLAIVIATYIHQVYKKWYAAPED